MNENKKRMLKAKQDRKTNILLIRAHDWWNYLMRTGHPDTFEVFCEKFGYQGTPGEDRRDTYESVMKIIGYVNYYANKSDYDFFDQ